MPIRSNGYYNNPAIGEAFQSLASVFAPPSGPEMAGYATAASKRAEAERLAWLFSNPTDPTASARSALTGVQSYGATPGGFAQEDATKRYGIDTTARTAIVKQQLENSGALDRLRATPLNIAEGNVAFLAPAEAAARNMPTMLRGNIAAKPGEVVTTPTGETFTGAPKPLSMDEWVAQQAAAGRTSGLISDEDMKARIMGSTPTVNVQTPAGPRVQYAPAAVGQEPYIEPKNRTNGQAVLPDGRTLPAVQDQATGQWRPADPRDGAAFPQGTRVTNMATPQGGNEALGIGKPAQNDIEKSLIDIATAKDTAVKLRDLIAKSPASQGVVGWLRGTAQNVGQISAELGQYFGGQTAQVADAVKRGMADANLLQNFDPNIPAIEMLANLLAFQYAKTTTGERLSNEMLRASRAALGLEGLDANQASAITRLDQAIERIQSQEALLNKARTGGVGALSAPAPPSPPPAGMAAPAAAPERWERGPDGKLRRVQ